MCHTLPLHCTVTLRALSTTDHPRRTLQQTQTKVQQRVLFPCFQLCAALRRPLCPLCRRLAGEQRVTRPGWQTFLWLEESNNAREKGTERSTWCLRFRTKEMDDNNNNNNDAWNLFKIVLPVVCWQYWWGGRRPLTRLPRVNNFWGLLLAPQTSAQKRGPFRDFHPNPTKLT